MSCLRSSADPASLQGILKVSTISSDHTALGPLVALFPPVHGLLPCSTAIERRAVAMSPRTELRIARSGPTACTRAVVDRTLSGSELDSLPDEMAPPSTWRIIGFGPIRGRHCSEAAPDAGQGPTSDLSRSSRPMVDPHARPPICFGLRGRTWCNLQRGQRPSQR